MRKTLYVHTEVFLKFVYPSAINIDKLLASIMNNRREELRDCARFAWIRNADKSVSSANVKILQFARMLFGVVARFFLLLSTTH